GVVARDLRVGEDEVAILLAADHERHGIDVHDGSRLLAGLDPQPYRHGAGASLCARDAGPQARVTTPAAAPTRSRAPRTTAPARPTRRSPPAREGCRPAPCRSPSPPTARR